MPEAWWRLRSTDLPTIPKGSSNSSCHKVIRLGPTALWMTKSSSHWLDLHIHDNSCCHGYTSLGTDDLVHCFNSVSDGLYGYADGSFLSIVITLTHDSLATFPGYVCFHGYVQQKCKFIARSSFIATGHWPDGCSYKHVQYPIPCFIVTLVAMATSMVTISLSWLTIKNCSLYIFLYSTLEFVGNFAV